MDNEGSQSGDIPELDLGVTAATDISGEIVNELIEKVTDAKSKNVGTALKNMLKTIKTHNLFKRIMSDDIEISLDSLLYVIQSVLNK